MNQTSRPLIGIAPSRKDIYMRLSKHYLDAVWRAGGLGVILSYTEDKEKLAEYAATFDGFLLSGGVDLDPVLYGEVKQFDSVEIDAERDAFELALLDAIYPTEKPILGICRGIQTLNVYLGGTLHQHMEGHSQTESGRIRGQHVTILPGTMLSALVGKTETMVNTFHHQAIKDVAPSLVVNAVSDDGFVEVVHDPNRRFLLATQFHPEIYHAEPDDDHSMAIFTAFVNACR